VHSRAGKENPYKEVTQTRIQVQIEEQLPRALKEAVVARQVELYIQPK